MYGMQVGLALAAALALANGPSARSLPGRVAVRDHAARGDHPRQQRLVRERCQFRQPDTVFKFIEQIGC